jgi:threonylcarbamoyladenosine tRNA methylthiotransferase MtaB
MKTRVSFYTFGCRLNQSETNTIEQTFRQDDYTVVDIHSEADIVIINTCTVTENGDLETKRLVQKVSRLNPQARIALIGCQAQIQKERLSSLPNVHWIVGNAKKMDIKSIIKETADQPQPLNRIAQVITPTISRDSFTIPITEHDPKHKRANLKIQDGCDFFCSFCEIPYARGRARSREFNDLLKEAHVLVEHGHQELVLTGINIGTYKHKDHEFMDVIDALEQIDGLKRIRISSIEPTTIPQKLIEKMSGETKLCRYLHVPLQSAHDEILSLMKRKYTSTEYFQFIKEAREAVEGICIGTDIIVGFPGETDLHFAHTEEQLREGPIDYIHVFSYSERHMAKSQHLPEPISQHTITTRSQILRSLSERKRNLFYQNLKGRREPVLFESRKENMWYGLTDNFVKVKFEHPENLSNQFITLHLNHVEDDAMVGILP